MAITTFELLETEYGLLWDSMTIRATKAADINSTANKIIANKARYEEVQSALGVPWFMVGAIHAMECGLRFDRHLHCGDPLTARTVHVPKGRPVSNPKDGKCYSWLESAMDALTMKNLQAIKVWSVERICFELERYNGWGYRNYHSETLSPYLWSGSNHYSQGKYIADGKWSATAVSGQSGAMALIKRVSELDASVAAALARHELDVEDQPEVILDAPRPVDPAFEFPKTDTAPPPVSDAASAVAVAAPPVAAPATPAEAHAKAHAELRENDWFYNLRRGLLKQLGIGTGTAGGVSLAASAFDDPVATGMAVFQFAKAHPLWIGGGVVAVILVIELRDFILRERAIQQKELQQ